MSDKKVKIQTVTGFLVPVSNQNNLILHQVINARVRLLTAQQSNHTLIAILNLCKENPIDSSLKITNTTNCHQELAFSFSSEQDTENEMTRKIAITVISGLLKNCRLMDEEDFIQYMHDNLETLNPCTVSSVIQQAYDQRQKSFNLKLTSTMTVEGHHHTDTHLSLESC